MEKYMNYDTYFHILLYLNFNELKNFNAQLQEYSYKDFKNICSQHLNDLGQNVLPKEIEKRINKVTKWILFHQPYLNKNNINSIEALIDDTHYLKEKNTKIQQIIKDLKSLMKKCDKKNK